MHNPLKKFKFLSEHSEIKTVSVDVFDTLLYRTTMPEIVKFEKIATEKAKLLQQIVSDHSIDARYILLLRIYAAKIVYRNKKLNKGAREATLNEIYDVMLGCMADDLNLSSKDLTSLRCNFHEIELKIESDDLIVNFDLKKILLSASQNGKRVIAISDMYLSYDDIKLLLTKKGVWELFDNLYVSSEFGFGKASGALFDEVFFQHNLLSCQVAHIGDNWLSDYSMPKSKGVNSIFYPRSYKWKQIHKLRFKIYRLLNGDLG